MRTPTRRYVANNGHCIDVYLFTVAALMLGTLIGLSLCAVLRAVTL